MSSTSTTIEVDIPDNEDPQDWLYNNLERLIEEQPDADDWSYDTSAIELGYATGKFVEGE